jgi:hypothetical protein
VQSGLGIPFIVFSLWFMVGASAGSAHFRAPFTVDRSSHLGGIDIYIAIMIYFNLRF